MTRLYSIRGVGDEMSRSWLGNNAACVWGHTLRIYGKVRGGKGPKSGKVAEKRAANTITESSDHRCESQFLRGIMEIQKKRDPIAIESDRRRVNTVRGQAPRKGES